MAKCLGEPHSWRESQKLRLPRPGPEIISGEFGRGGQAPCPGFKSHATSSLQTKASGFSSRRRVVVRELAALEWEGPGLEQQRQHGEQRELVQEWQKA